MKNYRAVIRDTLKSVQSDIPYDIKMAFPESKPAGNLITFYEITNTGTGVRRCDRLSGGSVVYDLAGPVGIDGKGRRGFDLAGPDPAICILGRAFTRPQRLFAQIIALRSSGRHKNQSID